MRGATERRGAARSHARMLLDGTLAVFDNIFYRKRSCPIGQLIAPSAVTPSFGITSASDTGFLSGSVVEVFAVSHSHILI